MRGITLSTCPVMKTEDVSLVERVVAGSREEAVFVPFAEKILWLRESEASISFWHGGYLVKDSSSFNDYYGFLTSFENAKEEAKALSKAYGISDQSTLEIRIYLSVLDRPVLEDRSAEGNEWNSRATRRRYQELPDNNSWFRNDRIKLVTYESLVKDLKQNRPHNYHDRLWELGSTLDHIRIQPIQVFERQVVWSSFGISNDRAEAIASTLAQLSVK